MSTDDPAGTASRADAPVPISPERHGARFWRRFTSFDFARAWRMVPVVLGEHEQVAASLPFFFVRTHDGLWPVALLRLSAAGPCALVAPNGTWRGAYVPSILRVHPFTARRRGDGQMVLLVDEASGLVTDDPADEAFFTPQGDPAPVLEKVIDFFRTRAGAETDTRAAMAEIAARKLLMPFVPPQGLGDLDATGLLVPDRTRLAALARADIAALYRCGALGLMQAQAVSVHHLAFLASAEAQLSQGDAGAATQQAAAPTSAPTDAAVSGFLDAVAAAHSLDMGSIPGPQGRDDGSDQADDAEPPSQGQV
ncbi:SapC family protein [Rhodovulum adriaticum]|uniref:SapC protein n=1 Tax=Rhodovulum adriaticum TaxID=35804 RepID=A0A4R2NYF5_RHOAD|nr:SapC family protein [Rhodovulum adriaticum]MBK1634142.1 hypothetical protein [Rhodovulum adriaticum]TCP27309.1 SapC protein [Rhodovulum adriaticum]